MPLIYITGPTASGKSTVCAYLRDKGYEAYDTNEKRIEELATKSNDGTIFLCGIAEDDVELAGYFDKIICLVIGIKTMKRRIATRTISDFGKAPGELEVIMGFYQAVLDKYANVGAIMIDASQPLDDVVNEVVTLTKARL